MNPHPAPIDRFSGRHAWLSNFHNWPFRWDGAFALTAEHHYQASKTHDSRAAARILAASTPAQAKRLGRKAPLREDWQSVKDELMHAILCAKFADPGLRDRLLSTGHAPLIEGNDWGDTYWGVCNGRGRNRLGETLQIVRRDLRQAYRSSAGPARFAPYLSARTVLPLIEHLNTHVTPHLRPDVSSYAPGRERAWLQIEAPLGRTQPWRPGLASDYLWSVLTRTWRDVHPRSRPDLGLAIHGDTGIGWHRDASYAAADALLVNLGRCHFEIDRNRDSAADRDHPATNPMALHLIPGDVLAFNSKHPHRVLDAEPSRWSIVLWRRKRHPQRPVPPIHIP